MSETEQVTGAPVEASPLPTFAEQAKAALGGEASSAPVVPAVPEAAPAVPAVPEAPAKSRVFAQYFQEHYGADLGGVSDEELAPQIGQILEGNQILEQRLAERERQLNEFLASQSEFEEFRRKERIFLAKHTWLAKPHLIPLYQSLPKNDSPRHCE